jgi:polyisoprenoid-binding protein YceI
MTNYLVPLWAAVLFAAACPAAEAPATRPAAPRFTQATGGSLTFAFIQVGAENHGSFRQFATELVYDEKNPAAGSLKVTVQIASLDTQDKDRDDALAGPDLFDAKKYPTAQYTASSFSKLADGRLEAVGKLTLRGTTRELRVPLRIQDTSGGVELSGEVTIKRLDYGVGQGEWKSTEGVGDDVKLQYKVPLSRAK